MRGLTQKQAAAILHNGCILVLVAFCGMGAKAQAEELSFNCLDLMISAGIAEKPQQLTEESYFTLVAPDSFDVLGTDPVNPIELLISRSTPIYETSDIARGQDPQFEMICYLIILEFELKVDRFSLKIEDANGQDLGERLPVLVVMSEETDDDLRSSRERWTANSFNISATFGGFQDGRREVRPGDFGNLRAFVNPVWDYTSIRMIGLKNTSAGVSDFLRKNAPSAEKILVMCGFGPCNEAPALQQVPATDHEETALGNSSRGSDAGQLASGDNPTPEQMNQRQVDAAVAQPLRTTTDLEPQYTSELTPKTFEGGFTYIQRDGTETAAPFDNIDRLECILLALAPELFTGPIPPCDSLAFNALGQTNALLQLGPQNQIQVVAEARYPDLELVQATLPHGVDGLTCQLLLAYDTRDGQTIQMPMEPITGSEPAAFATELAIPPLRDGVSVSLSIRPLDPTACGVDDKNLRVPSARTIDISLGNENSTTAILHLLLPRATQMAEDLALGEAERQQFVQSLINAVRGAHSQHSVRSADHIWSLTQASLISLTDTGSPNPILTLDSEDLRNGSPNAFLRVGPDTINSIADTSPQVTAGTLSELLTAAGTELSQNDGADRLVVTMIAPLSGRSAIALIDPCTDPIFQQLSGDLATSAMIDTEVFVFPIVRMQEGDRVDITRLQPINPDTVSPTLPSGLYQCVDSPNSVTILPYYFEPWRDPVEFAPRFATSLSSRLMTVLDDANDKGAN